MRCSLGFREATVLLTQNQLRSLGEVKRRAPERLRLRTESTGLLPRRVLIVGVLPGLPSGLGNFVEGQIPLGVHGKRNSTSKRPWTHRRALLTYESRGSFQKQMKRGNRVGHPTRRQLVPRKAMAATIRRCFRGYRFLRLTSFSPKLTRIQGLEIPPTLFIRNLQINTLKSEG